jgi:hypothetical protein
VKAAALAVCALVPAAVSRQTDVRFADPACHVAFRHPMDWAVHADTTGGFGGPCAFVVRATRWDSLVVAADSVSGVHTIWVRVETGPLEAVIEANGDFERRGAGWIVFGRHGLENPASPVTGGTWRGVQGSATVGCHRIEGGYVGLCEIPKAAVSDGARTVMVEGGPGTHDVFDRLLAALEILP